MMMPKERLAVWFLIWEMDFLQPSRRMVTMSHNGHLGGIIAGNGLDTEDKLL